MQAVIAQYIFNENGGSIPVCTDRKATGLFVLASFLFATMAPDDFTKCILHVYNGLKDIFDMSRSLLGKHKK